jgi:hypothetical protein
MFINACRPIFLFLLISVNITLYGQENDTLSTEKLEKLARNLRQDFETRKQEANSLMAKKIDLLKKQEAVLLKKLPTDVAGEADQFAKEMEQKLAALNIPVDMLEKNETARRYLPYIARFDSLESLLKFKTGAGETGEAVELLQKQIAAVRAQYGEIRDLEGWLHAREEQWKGLLNRLNIKDAGIFKEFNKWQQSALVYKKELEQWRENLTHPEKLETEILRQLQKSGLFRDFLSKNSELAALFGPPAGSANAPAGQPIPGLQTRASLAQELQSRFGEAFMQSGGALQQQLQAGMDQLADMQNPIAEKLNELKEANPFQLSPAQEEKAALQALPLKKRFEFGVNLQSATRIQDFPAVRDIGLSLGYKLNPRSVAGVGIAYKFALGESWKDIHWTHEGIGLRSFFDWRIASAGSKLLKGFWITGGFEMNYWSRIARDAQWGDLAWQKSGLVGVSKVMKYGKKEGKVQVLWSLLNSISSPSPLLIRFSKNL